MSFLEIRELTYTYPGGIRAIDGLNLDAQQGELIALIGPNAAGKSTLALLLKGLLEPDSGSIKIGGRERRKGIPDHRVGILFANPENQIVTSIVQEDIAFSLEVAEVPSALIAGKVRDVLDRLGICHLSGRMPHLLSGGEQQMVALAGALVQEPDILVLDEPTTFLDPDGKASVIAALRSLVAQGKTVVLITHDMSEAGSADRIVLLEQGRAVQDDPPMELFNRRDISEVHGITPPFLIRLALGMRSKGYEIEEPLTVNDVSAAMKNLVSNELKHTQTLRDYSRGKTGMTPALTFECIWFRYGLPSEGGVDLLADLDLEVPEGSIAMICGSNGSGKSTLLQIANGLLEPDKGRVCFRERPLVDLRKETGSIHSRIVLLFQNPERQLFSEIVFDDVAFGPRNLGLDGLEVKKRVVEAVNRVGLEDWILTRPIHTLSGGQMRRVAVAGVLAMNPAVLVLDEPTDGLDPGGVKEFFEGIHKYCRDKGTTVLMAAHKVPDEIRIVDHFSHLENGRIRSSGSPAEVLAGTGRTLPARYLPDHLFLQEKLFDMEGYPGLLDLDPVKVEEYLMSMIPERSR